MKILRCDKCNEDVEKVSDLIELTEPYQTNSIKEVCRNCFTKINKIIEDISNKFHTKKVEAVQEWYKQNGN